MSKQRPLILLTRPQMQSERFAQMCRKALGEAQQIIISPLLKIKLLPIEVDLAQYHGLVLTSENGVRSITQAQNYQGMSAYCVGERTAKAARAAGLVTYSADGSADDLIAMVNGADVAGPLLHMRGEHTRGDIAKHIGVQVDEVVTYRQTAQSLSEAAKAALGGDQEVILPLFSPRTAQIFFNQIADIKPALQVVVISQAVKEAILGSNTADCINITVADAPNADAMMQAISRLM